MPIRVRVLAMVTATCVALTTTSGASAQVRELRWDPPVDLTTTLVGGALWVASVALQPQLAPATCRWCASNALDDGARRALLWREPILADDVSDVTGFIFSPATAFGLDALAAWHDGAPRGIGLDALLITEATVLALDVNQLTKVLLARQRPYVQAIPLDAEGRRPHVDDDFLSFFSGHTTGAFALAASAGTVATMRGYRWAPAVWIATGVFATSTGYLRIAADRHWLTDVLLGMIIGVGVGIAVPVLFHSPPSG
jgi:membrane-associated phospholipid phosphatase